MEQLDQCYTVLGTGGVESCIAIQERLQQHGLCSLLRWDPDPNYRANGEEEPQTHWRFFFETNLKRTEALSLLGTYAARYNIHLK
jgi:hypothetical protein